MYTALILILIAAAGYFIITGVRNQKKQKVILGVSIGIFSILFFNFMDFWGEMLWFESLGYNDRFWTYILAQAAFGIAGALISLLAVSLLTYSIPKNKKIIIRVAQGLAILIGGTWGVSNWEIMLKFWFREMAGISEPIFNLDGGFYLFALPFLDRIYVLIILITLLSIAALFATAYLRFDTRNEFSLDFTGFDAETRSKLKYNIIIAGSVLILALAFDKYLSRYHLMYSNWGVVRGPGWTDVNILIPAYDIIIVLMIIISLFLLIKPLRNILEKFYNKLRIKNIQSEAVLLISVLITIIFTWFIALTVIPGLFQWLRVNPNEITFERPYIEHNIKLTRFGFNLQDIEEKEFAAKEVFNEQIVSNNRATFDNIRLWDWRALDAVYKQFQEIRLYYEFKDVDIDRYTFNDQYRQVMVSAREMEPSNLPQQSQTFVNQRFKYTHGFGITLTTVNDFNPEGLPNLLIKDIPPKSKYPELEVKKPQIYYGELTDSYVVVNSDEPEFDYPSGEKNVYIDYPGTGGVRISNLWRKFLYGWKFDGTSLLLSGYPNENSRIMFHRQIEERVKNLAPFLVFDEDPYIVLGDNGELYWIIDAYTTSDYFPYSETYNSTEQIIYKEAERNRALTNEIAPLLDGVNYVRNSVKAVVDAFDGSVEFYIYDESDPLIKVWDKIFPELFKKKNQMPDYIQNHVRYPIDFLLVQGLVYAKYHMTDPTVFYNQEDLWIRATEKYYNEVQPVDPYYIMWELPEKDHPEFVLILPFTPKNRQVLIGWIAGMCDGENYGKFLAYKFPKEKRILGTQQVETKIDQDSFLSGQLSLWDQRGSNVIRGNVLAIPVEETIIYVEPIYLQAETAAYPELRLVAVMHNDDLSYAETFEEALQGLYGKAPEIKSKDKEKSVTSTISINDKIRQANDAFENYLRLQGDKKFEQAARELEKLQRLLNELSKSENSGNNN
jgi:uncharacterized membrane protein (UPF0182 family)